MEEADFAFPKPGLDMIAVRRNMVQNEDFPFCKEFR